MTMDHPRSGFTAPLQGATPAARQSRLRGVRLKRSGTATNKRAPGVPQVIS
jgi:hypothetical protein